MTPEPAARQRLAGVPLEDLQLQLPIFLAVSV